MPKGSSGLFDDDSAKPEPDEETGQTLDSAELAKLKHERTYSEDLFVSMSRPIPPAPPLPDWGDESEDS